MTLRYKVMDALIDRTMGTCQSLDYHLEGFGMELDDLSLEELTYIDDAIFECGCCGWWYDLAELSDMVDQDTVCVRCVEDGDYEI